MNTKAWRARWGVGVWLGALGVLLSISAACSDREPARGCVVDTDCRGARVCVEGACQLPDEGAGAGDVGVEDTGGGEDVGDDDAGVTAEVGVGEDVGPPDTSPPANNNPTPGNPCMLAEELLASCDGFLTEPEWLGVDWDACFVEPNGCAADCVLEAGTCAELSCDFNPDIDCDDAGAFTYCFQERCQEPPPPPSCDEGAACVSAYDCCGGRWLCGTPDTLPATCDLDCVPPGEPPACECFGDRCEQIFPSETTCDVGYSVFLSCGYTLDDPRLDAYPGERERLTDAFEGECDDDAECVAGCVREASNDGMCTGLACHYGELLCAFDAFGECLASCAEGGAEARCAATGGSWVPEDGCGSCCGPPRCGQDPNEECGDACCGMNMCACPPGRPFWDQSRGCFDDPACYP